MHLRGASRTLHLSRTCLEPVRLSPLQGKTPCQGRCAAPGPLNTIWQLLTLHCAASELETSQQLADKVGEQEQLQAQHLALQAQHATAKAQLAVVGSERDSLGALVKSYEYGHDAGERLEASRGASEVLCLMQAYHFLWLLLVPARHTIQCTAVTQGPGMDFGTARC